VELGAGEDTLARQRRCGVTTQKTTLGELNVETVLLRNYFEWAR